MRILVVSDLPQFVTGGAEMQAARLIEAWVAAGHEVMCLGRRMGSGPVTIGEYTIRTGRIRNLRRFGRPARALTYFLSLAWLLFRWRRWADVVYCRFLGDAAATAAILKRMELLNAVLVPTPANAGKDGDISYLRSIPGSQRLVRLLDRECNAINLIAPQMSADLENAGFSSAKLTRIPNGIPILPSRRSISTGAIRIVSTGRLSPQKGYDLLIEALATAPDLSGRLHIEIFGDGPERSRLLEQAATLAPGLIRFIGEIPPGEVPAHLDAADIFILPSRYEGMSNSALEAMERGLPLLITACGGIDTYVGADMGWVVPANDPVALASTLRMACDMPRPTLSTMGANCRRLAEQEFGMSRVAQRYLDLFDSLIHENRRRHT